MVVYCSQAEDHFGRRGPLDGMTKFESVMRAAGRGNNSTIHWLLSAIYDVVLNEGTPAVELSVAALSGKKGGSTKSKGRRAQSQQSQEVDVDCQ